MKKRSVFAMVTAIAVAGMTFSQSFPSLAAEETTSEKETTYIENDETGIPDKVLYDKLLSQSDKNGDGRLSVAEAEAQMWVMTGIAPEWEWGGERPEEKRIKSLKGIEYFKNLNMISLIDHSITDITPLSGLTNLTSLCLYHNKITDITPLSGLTNLASLSLGRNEITDITVLSGMTNLTSLSLDSNNIEDITAIEGLTILTSLELGKNRITDITALSGLTNITALELEENEITDITPLSGMKNLKHLYLDSNKITDISPVKGATNLETLSLSDNAQIDIAQLKDFMSVKYLYLNNNRITDITPLSGLTNLELLGLENNEITDITPVKGLSILRVLQVANNNLTSLPDLTGLPLSVRLGKIPIFTSFSGNKITVTEARTKLPSSLLNDEDEGEEWFNNQGFLADSGAGRVVPYYSLTSNGGTWNGNQYTMADGTVATDAFFFDGSNTYYLQADGSPMRDTLTYHPDGEHIIYLDSNGHEVFNSFQYCPSVGYTCYFDSNGYLYKDQITFVGDKTYYLNLNGKLENEGWFQFGNGMDYGYANWDGTLNTCGFSYDPWGRVVFYHWNGMVARGLITDGQWYYLMDETDGHYVGSFPVN
ncbi:leucine-rich repeat domain-containing protein [Roseburia sp. 499]|uniref:leucine-rich repeat domain-containing protein n=1 Tax=Roseburia sp. 499 TaxID=1261634 RepID=UPI0009522E64|nr:leucine-rich repeat domain-containing protein [Roseburia sp. 499]WVK69438.1 leucine-rich repeat domain-containing protein [Roseburia sp. 499]